MNQYTNQNNNYQRVCPRCGKPLDYDNMYCPKCGYDFTGNKENNKKKNLIISILVVLIITMIFIIAALAVSVKVRDKDEYEPENTEKAEALETSFVETPAPEPKKTEKPETDEPEETKEPEPQKTEIPENDVVTENGKPYAYGPYDVIMPCSLLYPEDDVVTSPTYNKYRDSEFGFSIDYPAEFGEYGTENPVIRGYYTSDDGSAHLRVCAAYNEGGITPEQMKSSFISTHGGSITYEAGKSEWFAISLDDYADDRYHYAYYSVREGKIIGFEFHFEGQQNIDTYSKYIDAIYASLKR